MPEFAYTARSVQGQDSSGVISAGSRREAIALLAEKSLFPLQVEAQAAAGEREAVGCRWQRRVKSEVLADTFTQLSDLLSNGVPLLESLDILSQQSVDQRLAEVLRDVREQVADGTGLDTAMASHPRRVLAAGDQHGAGRTGRCVPGRGSGTHLVVSAQAGGAADENHRLDDLPGDPGRGRRRRHDLPGACSSSRCSRSSSTGWNAPGPDCRWSRSSWWRPASSWCATACSSPRRSWRRRDGCASGWRTATGRALCDRWKLKIPVAGQIFHDAAVARFCRVLGTLLRNGVPLLTALRISSESTGNQLLQQAVLESVETVSSGDSLSRPLAASGLIPPQIMAMIRIAEEANTLDEVLVRIADRIDQRIERQLDMMVRMVEPIMLLVIGSMVLFIIVGVLLPVFDLNASIG